jgi:sirohydrochlorin cobaltochelatase
MREKVGVEGNVWGETRHGTHFAVASVVERQDCISPRIGTACLELASLPLCEQIQEFGKKSLAAGCRHLQVLPLFLLPGVHVMEDIPAEVAIAQAALGSNLQIRICPHLGSHPGLERLLANQLACRLDLSQPPLHRGEKTAWILLSHGSRRAGGNQPVEAIAATLGAIPAYWSVPPSLESHLLELVSSGHNRIGILPYFLFPGGITDAIAEAVGRYRVQFSSTNLHLAEPIGASAELADLIWDLTRE